MRLFIDTETGLVELEGHLIPEEVLEVTHTLMDIAFDLQEDNNTDKRFTAFSELYRRS